MRLRLCLLLIPIACTTDFRTYYPEVESTPPAQGTALLPTLASLFDAPSPAARVAVTELRVLRVDQIPWKTLSTAALATESGRIAAVAQRTCRIRERILTREEAGSGWYLFEDGRLRAFDHVAFDAECHPVVEYAPMPADDLSAERGLARYVGQRYTAARPSAEVRLQKGMALVGAGRLQDAQRELNRTQSTLDSLVVERDQNPGVPHPELDERIAAIQAGRVELDRALRKARLAAEKAARGEAEAP